MQAVTYSRLPDGAHRVTGFGAELVSYENQERELTMTEKRLLAAVLLWAHEGRHLEQPEPHLAPGHI